ncbi:MAG: phenylalanine--tRNA ligase subunit beta [Candidatus Acidiferrales bacterium]
MKVLYNWLKEFVAVTATPEALRTRLSLAGIAVDAIEETADGPLMDAEITINRPDCLGHYGIAREAATLERLPLKRIQPSIKETTEKTSAVTRVEIECPELCGRYTARILRGVKVQTSPEWLRRRLEALGQSSINNVVDATNYVLLELGQPQHAFDFDRLSEKRIVVRRARKGEKIRTLDGIERALSPEMCVIADAARVVAIGGVMGGADSEISFATRNILLESAWFDAISIRRTSKTLGLRTEASTRFERGTDPEMAELASRRACELIQQLAGGELLAGAVDVYPGRQTEQKIAVTRKELLRVMGADVPDKEIEAILDGLGFAPRRVDANRGSNGSLAAEWETQRPSWRQDVTREIDLIEEIARHYGFDKFPARLPPARQAAARLPHAAAEAQVRERLIALGYQEILEIPLVDAEADSFFRRAGTTPAKISNPLAEDAATMRTSGILSMLRALEWNLNRGQKNLRLFETGKRYELREGKPLETRLLTLGATGKAREKSVYEAAREFAFEDLKGDLDCVGELAGGFRWANGAKGAPDWLHPGRFGSVTTNRGEALGRAGQLARRTAEHFKLRQDVFLAEFALETFLEAAESYGAALRYRPLSRFPAVERDYSVVLADGTPFAAVRRTIDMLGIEEIIRVEAVDLFRGGQVPSGNYSLLVRVTFESQTTTLAEEQLSNFSSRIMAALEKDLGAHIRTA